MMLQSGMRLGPYEILGPLGAGGMGEVYRARDARLNRDVAVKILPELFAADADRLARFQREAQVLASLNHPNIAQVYGLEEQPPTQGGEGRGIALVMELVDGLTLADRLTGGLPLDEALAIARQIADALEAAHDKGIVHRDLKPANVKITTGGIVKVLDFGLARPGDFVTAGPLAGAETTALPTITSPAVMTGVGVILGTAAYMSPEQARGRPVDKRADIWAFGCVLYEMLTGRRAFTGDDVTDTIGAVIHKEPDWSLLGPDTPASVRLTLQRCLAKQPKQRFHDIGDVRLALDGVFDLPAAIAPPPAIQPRRLLIAAALVAASVVAVTATAVAVWSLTRSTPVAPMPIRFTLNSPPEVQLGQFFALSPDGHNVAFFASDAVEQRLWIHSFETGETRLLSGAGRVSGAPFWSADSRFIAYVGEGRLKRIDLSGGPAEVICDAPNFAGGSWNRDGTVVFAVATSGLMRVAAAGGTPIPVTSVDPARNETAHSGPWFLPDGRHFLYLRTSKDSEHAGMYVGALDATPEEQSTTRLLTARQNAQYMHDARTGAGHLVFMRDGTLMAQPFDPARLALGGEAVRVAEEIGTGAGATDSYGYFWVSNAQALAYRRNQSATASIVWTSRTGQEMTSIAADVDRPSNPKLSPDGRKLAAIVAGDLWVYDLEGRPPIRLTFSGSHYSPFWTPDGRRIAHESGSVVMAVAADGSGGSPEAMSPADGHFHPHGWSHDGREIILVRMAAGPTRSSDIVRFSWQEKGKPQNVVSTDADEGANGAALVKCGRRCQRRGAVARRRVAGVCVQRDGTARDLGTPIRARRSRDQALRQRRSRARVGEEWARAVLSRTEQDDERGRERRQSVQLQTRHAAVRESPPAHGAAADLRCCRGWPLPDDQASEFPAVIVQCAAQLESGCASAFPLTATSSRDSN
jgi:Tol biopolymer transport system component